MPFHDRVNENDEQRTQSSSYRGRSQYPTNHRRSQSASGHMISVEKLMFTEEQTTNTSASSSSFFEMHHHHYDTSVPTFKVDTPTRFGTSSLNYFENNNIHHHSNNHATVSGMLRKSMDAVPSSTSLSFSDTLQNQQAELLEVNDTSPNTVQKNSSSHIKRRTSFKESLLSAVATMKPRKIIEKLSPRGHNNIITTTNSNNANVSSLITLETTSSSKHSNNNHAYSPNSARKDLHHTTSVKHIENEEEIDLSRRSLDPCLLQVDRIRKENNVTSRNKVVDFITSHLPSSSHNLKRETEFTTLVRRYLNPHLVLHIFDYISFPIGRFLSKTTKTPYKDDYLKLFFGKFNIRFFNHPVCSSEIYLIFKNIIITDNYHVDFVNFSQLFRTVPLRRIESLAILQFNSSLMSSSFASLRGILPKILYHCTSLKSLYINSEFVTGEDLRMILGDRTDTAASDNSPSSNGSSTTTLSSLSTTKKRKNSKNHNNCMSTLDPKIFETKLSSQLWNTLEELVIGERVYISKVDVAEFKKLKQFAWRSLSESPSEGLFSFMNDHFNLTTLELSKVNLKSTQIRNIFSAYPSLTNLKIEYLHSRLSHQSITYLQKNTTLKRLTLRYCKNADYNSGDVICISVANHPTLQYLDISGMEVRDEALNYLLVTNTNKVSILKAKGRLITKNDTPLKLNDHNNDQSVPVITGQGFNKINLNQTITYLDLTNQPITAQGLEFIAHSTSIRHLILRHCSLSNETVAPLLFSQLPISKNIRSLDLSRNNLNDRFMFVAGHDHHRSCTWQSLEQLALSGNPMSTNVIKGLTTHTHMLSENFKQSLKRLFINDLNVRDEGFRLILLLFPNLEHIEANNCNLTNKSLLLVGNSKSLLKCKVNQNDLVWDKTVLHALFIENMMLESVGIVSQILQTEKEFKRLAKALKNNRNIQSLTINHCLIPKKGSNVPSLMDDSDFYVDLKAEDQFRIECYHIGKIRFVHSNE